MSGLAPHSLKVKATFALVYTLQHCYEQLLNHFLVYKHPLSSFEELGRKEEREEAAVSLVRRQRDTLKEYSMRNKQ